MYIDKNTNQCTWLKCIPETVQKDRIVTGTIVNILRPGYYRYGTYDENEIKIHDKFYTNNKICHFGDPDFPSDFYKGFYGKMEITLDRDDIDIQFPKTFHCTSFLGPRYYLYDNLLDLYYDLRL